MAPKKELDFEIAAGEKTRDGRSIVSRATARHIHCTPRKLRLVVDLIRNKTCAEALETLRFTHRPSAVPFVERLLKSAMANAVNKVAVPSELVVGEAIVEAGRMDKRRSYAPMGRAVPIRKRRAHVHIRLTEV